MRRRAPPGMAWRVTAVGALAVMAALAFGRFSYTVLLPPMREGLRLSYTLAGLLATANLAGYLAGSLVSGNILRRLGARATAAWALGVLALALAWTGAAQGPLAAGGARALAGAAGAVAYVQALGLVALWFSPRERGLASGMMHAGSGAGLVLTGVGLPLLLDAFPAGGWRLGWLVLALVTLGLVPLGWAYLRFPPAPSRGIGQRRAGETEEPPPRIPCLGPSVAGYAGLYGLFGLSYVIYVTFFVEALRDRGLTPSQTGLVWAIVGTLSLVSGPLGGVLSDRIGRMGGLAVMFGLQAIAYAVFLEGTLWGLTSSVALFGLTAWGIPAIVAAAMGDVARTENAMTAFGRVTTVMGIGQAVGPVLAGALADTTGIVSSGLWISTLTALCGVAWSLPMAFAKGKARLAT